jgi:N-formylmaleamate deformylase
VELGLFDLPQDWRRGDWRTVLPRVACPVLLLTGETGLGAAVSPAAAARAARLLADGQVVSIAGAGHSIRRDRPVAYLEAVRRFLAQCYG